MKKKTYVSPGDAKSLSVSLEELMPIIRERLGAGQSVTIYPRGVSMLPTLKEGRDSVTLTAYKPPLKRYEIALFQRTDGTFVLHRAVKAGATYSFLGDAQYKEESGIKDSQIIGVVTEITRNGKQHSMGAIYAFRVRVCYFLKRVKRRIKKLRRKAHLH